MDENSLRLAGRVYELPGIDIGLIAPHAQDDELATDALIAALSALREMVLIPAVIEIETGRDDSGAIVHAQLATEQGRTIAMYNCPGAEIVPDIDADTLSSWLRSIRPIDALLIRGGHYRVDASPGETLVCAHDRGTRSATVSRQGTDGVVFAPAGTSEILPPFTLQWLLQDREVVVTIYWSHWLDGVGAGPLGRWLRWCAGRGWLVSGVDDHAGLRSDR